jgi:hypothetical protein
LELIIQRTNFLCLFHLSKNLRGHHIIKKLLLGVASWYEAGAGEEKTEASAREVEMEGRRERRMEK